ncbi:MAG: hypothetical protein HY901_26075 [Deltaproteobacteria bacterium]|nr:hypothetical protein [Deltaproteobacteria bacterium]
MKPTQPKTDDPSCMELEELLEPALVAVLEDHVVFNLDSAKKVVRAVTAITCRYLFHAGGSPVLAMEQFTRGLRLARRKHASPRNVAGTAQPRGSRRRTSARALSPQPAPGRGPW